MRDLHDVVADNITVINVQANTALHLMDRRIVQEALTNSARQSGSTNVTVRVACRDDALVAEVDDDGPLRPPAQPPGHPQGTGSGIAGMTERAAALGGTPQARPRPGGGFAVRAWLPLRQGPQHGGDR